MGKTKIAWCQWTINAVTGCSHSGSVGCDRCYAFQIANRFWGSRKFSELKFHPERLEQIKKIRKPSYIFLNSMSDLFHPDVKKEWIDTILGYVSAYPQHTFLILTKRPENIQDKLYGQDPSIGCRNLGGGDYYKNLMIGVSVENQEAADQRIPILQNLLGFPLFLSIEPMLGEISLSKHFSRNNPNQHCPTDVNPTGISWVIVGGETGMNARYMDPKWTLKIYAQCESWKVPFFFKSWGTANKQTVELIINMEKQYPKI